MSARADRLARRQVCEPLSRPLRVDEVPDDGMDLEIAAEPAECVAIADRVGLPAVGAVAAAFHIERRPGGSLHVGGELTAKVTQICVVSLEPFESQIAQPVEISFAPPKAAPADRAARQGGESRRRMDAPDMPSAPTPDEDDPPDPIIDGCIDLGAVAVEFLTLGLDFYPKKPGVQYTEMVVGDMGAPKPSAFAALERLKDRS